LDSGINLQQNPTYYLPLHLKLVSTLPCETCCGYIRLSASHWWCSWACPSLGKRTWYLSVLMQLSVVYTSMMCCRLSSYCFSYGKSLTIFLSSSNTVLLHIRLVSQSAFWNGRHHLIFQTCGFEQSRSEAPRWLQNLERNAAQWLYQITVYVADELKQCMPCLAHGLEQSVIIASIYEWHKPIHAHICAKGRHLSI